MALQLEDLDLLVPTQQSIQQPAHGRPLMVPIDAIDEDPCQPRREFDADALRELAGTIAQHGVLQAISVRSHPKEADRWMLNSARVGYVPAAWRARPRSQPSSTSGPIPIARSSRTNSVNPSSRSNWRCSSSSACKPATARPRLRGGWARAGNT